MMWFLESAEKERAEKTLELPVIGAHYAPSLIRFLEQQGTVILPEPEDPEEMVLSQEVPVVLRILAGVSRTMVGRDCRPRLK